MWSILPLLGIIVNGSLIYDNFRQGLFVAAGFGIRWHRIKGFTFQSKEKGLFGVLLVGG